MSTVVAVHPNAASRNAANSAQMVREGWVTLALHAVIMIVTASTVLKVDQSARLSVLIPAAVGGLLVGFFLARLRIADILAHAIALVSGVVFGLAAVAENESGARALIESRGRLALDLGSDIVTTMTGSTAQRASDRELLALIATTLWLVGYSSAWMLYRRHWLVPALMLPAVMTCVSLRFESQPPIVPLAVLLLCALVIAARHHIYVRSLEWERTRVPVSSSLPGRFTRSGALLGLMAVGVAWSVTPNLPNSVPDAVNDQALSAWNAVERLWNRVGEPSEGRGSGAAAYSDFSSSFTIGQPIELSHDPVASLETRHSEYVAVRRFDTYTGLDWETSDADPLASTGSGSPPQMTFAPGQDVPLDQSLDGVRPRVEGRVTVYYPLNDLVFTIESFISSSLPTRSILGWQELDAVPIDVSAADPGDVPVDLRDLVDSLRNAEGSAAAGPEGGNAAIDDPILAARIAAEQDHLADYPVSTSFTLDPELGLVLVAAGRVPVYSDITSVMDAGSRRSGTYTVTGERVAATASELREVETEYPTWSRNRYLQRSGSETERTRLLANRVAAEAGATNAYDKAVAIESYLQSDAFTYAQNSESPPSSQDAVDFFLFDQPIGRCEHFASAMVVLLRDLDIPARLVAGFRPTDETDLFGYLYRMDQAHTWVEAYFPGFGWVPFEPTKGESPFARGPMPEAPRAESTVVATVQPAPTVDPSPTPSPEPTIPPDATSESGSDGGGMLSATSRMFAIVAIAAVGFVTGLLGLGLLLWSWGLRGLKPGAALYAKSMRLGRLWGVRADSTTTPNEYAARVGRAVPQVTTAAQAIADLYQAERYGGRTPERAQIDFGESAWRRLRRASLTWKPARNRPRRYRTKRVVGGD